MFAVCTLSPLREQWAVKQWPDSFVVIIGRSLLPGWSRREGYMRPLVAMHGPLECRTLGRVECSLPHA